MKRDRRTLRQRYRRGFEAGDVLKQLCTHNLKSLITWLEQNLSEHEQLSISCWHDEFYYIEVLDLRYLAIPHQSVAGMRAGFTVDIKRDRTVWSGVPYKLDPDDPEDDKLKLPLGGNCFIRGNKWKRLLKQRYAHFYSGFHVYKDVTISQLTDRELQRIA